MANRLFAKPKRKPTSIFAKLKGFQRNETSRRRSGIDMWQKWWASHWKLTKILKLKPDFGGEIGTAMLKMTNGQKCAHWR